MTPEQLDALWMKNYGISRSAVNRDFLGALPKDIHILEVGCNIGNQLLLLQELGFSNLQGLEIQDYALELARRQGRGIQFSQGSAFNLPFADDSFDLVFTSGVRATGEKTARSIAAQSVIFSAPNTMPPPLPGYGGESKMK